MKVCSIQSCPGKVQAASPGRYLPDFFSGLYVPRAEEGDPGEAEVLVRHEDSHRNEVWLTEVVYKATKPTGRACQCLPPARLPPAFRKKVPSSTQSLLQVNWR